MLAFACFSWAFALALVGLLATGLERIELSEGMAALAASTLLLGLLFYVIGTATEMVRNRGSAEELADTAHSQVKLDSPNAGLAAADEEKRGNT